MKGVVWAQKAINLTSIESKDFYKKQTETIYLMPRPGDSPDIYFLSDMTLNNFDMPDIIDW